MALATAKPSRLFIIIDWQSGQHLHASLTYSKALISSIYLLNNSIAPDDIRFDRGSFLGYEA